MHSRTLGNACPRHTDEPSGSRVQGGAWPGSWDGPQFTLSDGRFAPQAGGLGVSPSLSPRADGLRRQAGGWGCPPIYPSGRMYRKNHTAQATVMSMAFGASACGWTKPRPSDLTGPPDRKNGRRQAGGLGVSPNVSSRAGGWDEEHPATKKEEHHAPRDTRGGDSAWIPGSRLAVPAPSAPRAQRTPASPASARAPQASPGYPLPPRAPGGRYERSSLAACPARPR